MRMIGYKTQPFCGKHCCYSMLIGKRNRRMAKHQIKRKEERQWRSEV